MESEADYLLRQLIEKYFIEEDGCITNGYSGESCLTLCGVDSVLDKELRKYANDRGLVIGCDW